MDAAAPFSPLSAIARGAGDLVPAEPSTSPSSSSSSSTKADAFSEAGSQELPYHATSRRPDAERHPKGRRKRTVAKDKAILEAAYTANPKPDKTARLDIVRRVSLSEKEVQIWFQNRRQNDRRKARPLSPQEIAALRYGGMQIVSSSDPAAPYDQPAAAAALASSSSPAASAFASTSPLASPDRDPWLPGRFPLVLDERQSGLDTSPSSSHTLEPAETSSQLSRSFPGPVGYLANRWNAAGSFSTPPASTTYASGADDAQTLEPSPRSSSAGSAPILPLPRSQRQFRLSLSLDGKAEVKAGLSPSPPRPQAPPPSLDSSNTLPPLPRLSRPSGLQRSQSALPSITLPPISALTGSLAPGGSAQRPPRALGRGRSRDAHAWEFACDAETRDDELTAQAEHESNGSAVAAINLLRSTSGSAGSVLQPNSSKRNAPWPRPASRASNTAKKPKLSRASSSVGRMESAAPLRDASAANKNTDPKKQPAADSDDWKSKKLKVSTLLATSGNDSDKENLSPDEDGNAAPRHAGAGGDRRPLPPPAGQRRTAGRVLKDLGAGPAFLNRPQPVFPRRLAGGNGKSAAVLGELDIFEDGGTEKPGRLAGSDAVERFMHGAEVSPSKKGDMDCVAGLLSLSQGNWR